MVWRVVVREITDHYNTLWAGVFLVIAVRGLPAVLIGDAQVHQESVSQMPVAHSLVFSFLPLILICGILYYVRSSYFEVLTFDSDCKQAVVRC